MAEESRAQLKSYLETGDIPTQAQMANLVDSCPNILDNGVLLDANAAVAAFAGGGQANATILTKLINLITVCAAPGDSVRVAAPQGGKWFAIVNGTANSCNIFPQAGAQIDLLGVNNPLAMASGTKYLFACSGTNWASFKSA
jgi:hypothetical protein